MKKNHFIRIFIVYMLIILAGSILIGLFSVQLFKYYFINAAEIRMNSNVKLIEDSILEQLSKDGIVNFDYLAKKYSEDIGSTVTFIDQKGNVIGERIKGINKGVNYLKNIEVINAKKDGFGYNFYYNDRVGIHVLNIAKYINNDIFSGFIHLSTPLREVKEVNKGIFSYSLIGVIFVLISSFILKLFFEQDIIKPLQYIADSSRNINGDNIQTRLNINSDDVLGIAAREYNKMLDRIQSKIDRLEYRNSRLESAFESINVGIIILDTENRIVLTNSYAVELFNTNYSPQTVCGRKVIELIQDSKINNLITESVEKGLSHEIETDIDGEQKKTMKVLINPIIDNANSKNVGSLIVLYDITQIRKFEKMSADFVSNVTHELKTPLTSIKGFIETLKAGAIEDKEVSFRFLEIIDLECDRLYSLINSILQLSEIQNIRQDKNLGFCYIQDVILEVVAFLDNQSKKKEINISIDIQDDMPLVLINKDRIKQMLINIVDNAIKYTLKGGYVKIKALKEDEHIMISVKDNGIGIPEKSLPRLFERFYRVDKGRSRSQGGTGLGLSIVKQIVDLYNGSIDVKSEVGKGTEFIVRLPIKPDKLI